MFRFLYYFKGLVNSFHKGNKISVYAKEFASRFSSNFSFCTILMIYEYELLWEEKEGEREF